MVFNMSDPPQGTKKPFFDRTRKARAKHNNSEDFIILESTQFIARRRLPETLFN
jgi:hypothetical protein